MDITGKTVLIFGGKTGLLGQALTAAFKQAGAKPVPLSSADCDILDPLTAQKWLDKKDPDILINAAAYTQVDQAEDEEEMAFALNATAPPCWHLWLPSDTSLLSTTARISSSRATRVHLIRFMTSHPPFQSTA